MQAIFHRFLALLAPPWIALFLLSAVLFVLGAANFSMAGMSGAAQVGVVGALVAAAAIVAMAR